MSSRSNAGPNYIGVLLPLVAMFVMIFWFVS